MSENDFDAFAALLDTVYSLYGKPLSAEAKAIHFRALADWPLAAVRSALQAHVKDPQRGQFAPKPADLIVQREGEAPNAGWPGPDEAWAIALSAQNEAATVVWTAEMAEAFDIARPVLTQGDAVGARMAFRDAYKRLVDAARQQRRAVCWQASLGWDADLRTPALTRARSAHRLSAAAVAALLPSPEAADHDDDLEKARANLQRLREQLAAMPAAGQRAEEARQARLSQQRERLEAKKREMAVRVAQYERTHGRTAA